MRLYTPLFRRGCGVLRGQRDAHESPKGNSRDPRPTQSGGERSPSVDRGPPFRGTIRLRVKFEGPRSTSFGPFFLRRGTVCYQRAMGSGQRWVRDLNVGWLIAVACASACREGGSSPILGGVLTATDSTTTTAPPTSLGAVTSTAPTTSVMPTALTTNALTTPAPTSSEITTTSVAPVTSAEPETVPVTESPTSAASVLETNQIFLADAGASTVYESSAPSTTPVDCDSTCAAVGGSCQDGACVFTCGEMDACPGSIRCPDGLDCRIQCTGTNSCAGGVVCPTVGGQLCDVECGQDACKGGVVCGGTDCNVDCANGACRGVSGSATNLTLNCTGDGSCSDATLSCNAQNCNMTCSGSGSCMRGDINISANNATLVCQGNGACDQAINCSAGSCNITCNTSASACSNYCQPNGGQAPNGCP